MRNFRLLGFSVCSIFLTSAALAQAPVWNVYVDSISQGANSQHPMVIDKQGNVWALFWDNDSVSIGEFDGTTWSHYGPADGVPGGYTYDIISDHDGNIWMSADSGIAEFTDGAWHTYKIEDNLTGIRTYHGLAADSSGNIWVATFSKIFISNVPGGTYDSDWNECYRFDGNVWSSFTPPYIYNWNGFNAMAFAPDGTLWATGPEYIDSTYDVFQYGLWHYDGDSWKGFEVEQGTGFTAQPIGNTGAMTIVEGTALHPDTGGVWVTLGQSSPTSAQAIYYFNGSKWDTTGFSGRRFTNMWIAPDGDKYFRSDNRNKFGNPTDSSSLVIVKSNGSLDSIPLTEIPYFAFLSVEFDREGNPWLSFDWYSQTSNGLGLETFAAPSSVTPATASNRGIVCSVYPNPMNSGTAHVSISGAAGTYSVTLYNALGTVLETSSAQSGATGCELSTSNLPSGAYFIAVVSGASQVEVPVVKE